MKKKKKTNLGGWAAYPNTNVRLTTSSPRPQSYVSTLTSMTEEMCMCKCVTIYTDTFPLPDTTDRERKEIQNNGYYVSGEI